MSFYVQAIQEQPFMLLDDLLAAGRPVFYIPHDVMYTQEGEVVFVDPYWVQLAAQMEEERQRQQARQRQEIEEYDAVIVDGEIIFSPVIMELLEGVPGILDLAQEMGFSV